jgi:PKD repeat protein
VQVQVKWFVLIGSIALFLGLILFAGFLLPVLPTAQQITATTATPPAGGGGGTALQSSRDATPPTLTVPNDMVLELHPGADTVTVLYSVTARDDVDGSATLEEDGKLIQDAIGGSITISCNPGTENDLGVGAHMVQCSATDASGKVGTASFTITVKADATPPTVTITGEKKVAAFAKEPGDETVSRTTSEPLIWYDYRVTASDNKDGTATLTPCLICIEGPPLRQDDIGGSITIDCIPSDPPAQLPVGIHRIECSATDASGNVGRQSLIVSVVPPGTPLGTTDTIPPILTVPNNMILQTPGPTALLVYSVTAQDDVDGTATLNEDNILAQGDNAGGSIAIFCSPKSPYFLPPGNNHKVECIAADQDANEGRASFTVSVVTSSTSPAAAASTGTTHPTLSVPNGLVSEASPGKSDATVSYSVRANDYDDGTATLGEGGQLTQDGVGGSIAISCNPASGSVFPIDDHTVQCSATDADGNVVTASFTVSVIDPSATTPGLSTTTPAVDTSFKVVITVERTTTGPAPFTFQASASVSGGTGPYTYSWNFGDGQTSNEVSTQHQFQQPGTYNVAVTVTDANGKTASDSIVVTVSAPAAAAADAAAPPTTTTVQEDTTTTDEGGGEDTGGEDTDPEPTDETTTTDEGGEGEDTDPEPTDETTTTDEGGAGEDTDPEPTDETTTTDEGAADDSGGDGGPDGGESQ